MYLDLVTGPRTGPDVRESLSWLWLLGRTHTLRTCARPVKTVCVESFDPWFQGPCGTFCAKAVQLPKEARKPLAGNRLEAVSTSRLQTYCSSHEVREAAQTSSGWKLQHSSLRNPIWNVHSHPIRRGPWKDCTSTWNSSLTWNSHQASGLR